MSHSHALQHSHVLQLLLIFKLYSAQVQLIYLTSLIFNSSSTHLVHGPSSTNQLSNRVSSFFRVGSVHCQPYWSKTIYIHIYIYTYIYIYIYIYREREREEE